MSQQTLQSSSVDGSPALVVAVGDGGIAFTAVAVSVEPTVRVNSDPVVAAVVEEFGDQ